MQYQLSAVTNQLSETYKNSNHNINKQSTIYSNRQQQHTKQQHTKHQQQQQTANMLISSNLSKKGKQLFALLCIISISVTLLLIAANCCLANPTATIGSQNSVGLSNQQRSTLSGGISSSPRATESKGIFKRSFAGLGCLGVYDKAKFARLDKVCEECYTLYREPDIHTACRQDCFRNNVFTRCVDALLLSHEAKKFDEMVDELYGK